MALPPERITVKRRRDEDPVDTLQLPRSKTRPSAVWRIARTDDGPPLFSERSASSKPSKDPQPPKLTVPPPTAALGENLGNEDPLDSIHTASQLFHNIQPHGHEPTLLRKHASTSTITRPIRQAQKPQGAQKLYPEPRKFHLTKSTLSAPSQYYVSKTPAQRHRKSRKELAVFAEKTEQSLEAEDIYKDRTNDSDVHVQAAVGNKQDVPESKRARKRPNATAAERKWRTDNWGKPVEPSESAERATKTAQSVSEPSHQWDYESLELAEQLQQIALQEIQTQEKQLNDLSRHRLKTQPKPPKPRQSNVQQSVENGTRDDVMIDAADIDDNSLHVFDTYVRLSGRQDANVEYLDSNTCALQGTSSHKFGILVINENEEEFWETYGEDQESDAELNSDEEDENAEDFYGNDYPEDEVDSDDEFGQDAYDYRHGVSDDEDYGEGVAGWSDDEKEGRRPW